MDNDRHSPSKTTNITMKYNNAIVAEYGNFLGTMGQPPQQIKPLPVNQDYLNGNFTRTFAKKVNENVVIEINLEQANKLNQDLYNVAYINWVIIGPRENRNINGVIDPGVSDLNRFEIERVQKEDGIDLKKVLHNLLEYWQGH